MDGSEEKSQKQLNSIWPVLECGTEEHKTYREQQTLSLLITRV
jgi:hypothetical protein